MVLLEFSVTPLGRGESVSRYVARCIEVVQQSGLRYSVHSMGTIVEGELPDVLRVVQQCVETVARDADRVTCVAKLDYRKGAESRMDAKVDSLKKHLTVSDKTAGS